MHVSVIGSGSVGSALARGLAAGGHEVTIGSREPATVDPVLLDETGADAHFQATAAKRSDVVVLAVPGSVVVDLAAELAEELAGSVVVDPTNEYPEATDETSLAERVAAAAPEASVVKAFNTVGAEHLADPNLGGEQASMFVAGDDGAETVATLAGDVGFEPAAVVGDLSSAGRLEELARLWIDLANTRGREVAFRLLQG